MTLLSYAVEMMVSTHAPLAGSDPTSTPSTRSPIRFQPTLPLRGATPPRKQARRRAQVSTHAPLAGSDGMFNGIYGVQAQFQPTLPLRGATSGRAREPRPARGFNPRSPCGERPLAGPRRLRCPHVSTHAPLAGSDINWLAHAVDRPVSTHAPLAGSDPRRSARRSGRTCFNPRSPCGERL